MAAQLIALHASQNCTLPHIPQLFDPNFLDVLIPPPNASTKTKTKINVQARTNPLISALLNDSRTYTENNAQALKSTGSAVLDAFSQLNGWSFREVNDALENAWAEDPGLTLRMIWNMRSIHDGKAEKELFYRSFGWLYDNHPRTALSNLPMLVAPVCNVAKKSDPGRPHGYWKDLLNILALATCGELSNIVQRATFLHNYTPRGRYNHFQKGMTAQEIRMSEQRARDRAKERRKDLYQQFHERLVHKLNTDSKYQALYITVARMFAQQIRKDITILEELKTVDRSVNKERYYQLLKSISLAGKWAPSPAGSHDRVTNISTAICQLLFSPNENVGSSAIGPLPSGAPYPVSNDRENCVVLRSFYSRWILRPLRDILACPEPLMSANRWNEIRYSRVPSVCMANNKSHFLKHDPDGFQQYLVDVETGKRKISGATLMPHELVAEAIRLASNTDSRITDKTKFPKVTEIKKNMAEQEMKVVDAQWRSLVARLKENGNLDNCLAICDVSGSMGTINHFNKRDVSPIFPAVALSLMLASLSKPPFNAGFITFSERPEFFRLKNFETAGLADIVRQTVNSDWGMNTDFQAVFLDLLLPLARDHNIAKEDMVKRLFVFSDMQFDEAGPTRQVNTWETNYDLVAKAYQEAGYDVPEIVFWNLRGSSMYGMTVEVQADRKGVAMMSGFSPSMMKVFMGEAEEEKDEEWNDVTMEGEVVERMEDEFTPLNVMKKALFRKSYDGLVVID